MDLIVRVQGLEFRATAVDDEPRCLDIELAKLLGMKKPKDIRRTIERHLASGFLTEHECRAQCTLIGISKGGAFAGTTETRSVIEYWPTEVGALKLCTKVETPQAHAMVGHIIAVYRAAKDEFRRSHDFRFVNHLLMLKAGTWERTFWRELAVEVARVYGFTWDGRGTQPVLLAGAWERLYRVVLGDAAYETMKERNPEPCKGSNHHQLLNEQGRDLFEKQLHVVHALAIHGTRTPTTKWAVELERAVKIPPRWWTEPANDAAPAPSGPSVKHAAARAPKKKAG